MAEEHESAGEGEPGQHLGVIITIVAFAVAIAGALGFLYMYGMNHDKSVMGTGGKAPGQNRGMVLTVVAFVVAIAGALGFLYVFWTSHSTGLMGITIAMALGGMGAGLVTWTHHLMRHEEAAAERPPLPSSEALREAFMQDFVAGEGRIGRRMILGGFTTLTLALLGAGGISLLRSLFGAWPGSVLKAPVWHRGDRLVTEEGRPVLADTLQPGSTITVFPEGRVGEMAGQTVLIRVKADLLHLPQARSHWTPQGNVAFSRLCTHAGCPVALYEASRHLLLCPCHQSTFNVLTGARPTGGPAARPLPQLPLYVDAHNHLRAAGDFTEPPGPGFWSLPS